MSQIIEFDPDLPSPGFVSTQQKPQPLRSLAAAGRRVTAKTIARRGNSGKTEAWQEDAWDMYDLVGEQRFLASTLANRLSQARFYVGRLPSDSTEDIEVITSGPAYEAFQSIIGKGNTWAQTVYREGINLFVTGDGYLIGIPEDDTGTQVPDRPTESTAAGITPIGRTDDTGFGDIDISALTWCMKSVSEVMFETGGEVTIRDEQGTGRKYDINRIVMIRVWRPHPRRWWTADSPTRSSLPVLRELVGLTMHISAQVDSRLAGAGVFLIPESADRAVRAAAGLPEDGEELSPFISALMEAMETAIGDRSNASALVPVMPVVPDDSIEHFRFISFATPLDAEARALRDEAIRRLALGQDCPPELLLGVSGMNHWGAWLVREDVVTTHIEPPLALLCDAISTQFLWPVLEQQGTEDHESYVIWYDVDHLIMRPNRAEDANKGHAAGVISDASYRDALGFDESDAPPADPTDDVNRLILDMIRDAPTLVQNPGLAILSEQIRALVEGRPVPESPAEELVQEEADAAAAPGEEGSTEGGPPATDGETEQPEPVVASAYGADDFLAEYIEKQTGPERPRMLDLTHGGGGK